MVTHPGRRQVADHVVAGVQAVDLLATARGTDEAGMRLAHALGLAGGAGGVQDHRHVIGLDLVYRLLVEAGMLLLVGAAQFEQLVHADQARLAVVAHAARIVIDDVRDAGHGFAQLQHLVDLLLVFGKHEVDVCIA